MSWRFNRRRMDEDEDSDREDYFQDPFSFGFRTGFPDIDQMIESMSKRAERMGPGFDSNGIFYGYQVKVGPDGKPQVREFGNVRPKGGDSLEMGSREPFVDVVTNDKDQTLKVIAEMPGVQKEDIQLQATEDSLTVKATNNGRNYNTTVPLDTPVDPETARASYKNGVMEVVLKMKEAPKPKGTSIHID
jgi:HSP20 family protein